MARLVAAAHFPPPVHGMAVAVDDLVAEMERSFPVRRVPIGGARLYGGGAAHHLARVGRVLRAVAVLGAQRRRAREAFFSCDAGLGKIYTFALVLVARLLGYRAHLQHHSYAYIDRRSPGMAAIVRLAGPRSVHLVTAPRMQADFLARYPRAVTRVVGIARSLPIAAAPAPRGRRDPLVLGFLGNVTAEKGIGSALDIARAAAGAGIPVELRVAGPADTASAALLAAAADDEIAVTALGPVYGHDRDAFLDGIDVFLFPSRYVNESFGLVAWEAMARGRPVIAHRSGCLTADAVGRAGLVVERDDDLVARAVPVLRVWWDDPETLADAGRHAHAAAVRTVETSRAQVERLCADLSARTSAPSVQGELR